MLVVKSQRQLRALLAKVRKRTIGFVPTMGALHEGHLSLIRTAQRENDITVASIFVNPLQFGPKEDFRRYPRTFAKDRRLLVQAKADILFHPSANEMFSKGFSSEVRSRTRLSPSFHAMTRVLCGKSRPGHFDGVAIVIEKLFDLVRPDRAYFGQKDYQQSVVIRRLVRDLKLDVQIRTLPTVREKDGLALSSRNRYLKSAQRARALSLSKTLFWTRKELKRGQMSLRRIKAAAKTRLSKSVDRVDYLQVVDPQTLMSISRRRSHMAVLTACIVGKTRLIDNVIIRL